MVSHGCKLVMFGGYGVPFGPIQQGAEFINFSNSGHGYSNELHAFDLKKGEGVAV